MSDHNKNRIDEPTGTEFVGHEWDGIEELNTPLPRWWLWTFYVTIAWSLVYVILYPAWPMVEKATDGYLGWSSRGDLAQELADADAARQEIFQRIAATDITQLPSNPELMRQAVSGGEAAFKVNCVQCHGAGAAGYEEYGYPNLNDDDWIWGGELGELEFTLTHGIRWEGSNETRMNYMPAFGDIFDAAQLEAVTSHVLSLSGNGASTPAGAQLFEENCAACHQANGEGSPMQGAPALNDAIWLYGNDVEQVKSQIANPRHGVMPGWRDRLDPVTIKMLAAYVHSRGGGEETPAPAADPETPATDVETPAVASVEKAGADGQS